ncbi:MAG: recombinase family protein [Alphaproteobacteria bacterium]|nr:recombinase family protein [Alphaproteobacteria bacterium]
MAKRPVRCAIYTRKSSEEGLEQTFNSLDAQREAGEAYIASQKHEGWDALPVRYDDGGLSGGTMERPALQRLLADIAAGAVDVVVVYKVDRLTRSLADFAKIVDAFDGKGVSFVSVTQQFNTTTSMGRLTLNVLLSFAQFEREVTGERIRDKIAASKKKGMWMGGPVPLGYDLDGRSLVINEQEAATVRHIFEHYAALGSVHDLKAELDRDGYVSKRRVNGAGRESGGQPFSRGALYLLLQNRLYHGEIEHKGAVYPGQHEAIVDDTLWNRVQAVIASNRVDRETGTGAAAPSLLAGLVFDANGERLTPTHANKRGTRYRYYVSKGLVRGEWSDGGWRLPAGDLETLVQNRVIRFLADEGAVHDAVSDGTNLDARRRMVGAAADLATRWQTLAFERRRAVLCGLLSRIVITTDGVDLMLRPHAVAAVVDPMFQSGSSVPSDDPGGEVRLHVPAKMRRVGKGNALVIGGAEARSRKPDPALLRLLAQAQRYRSLILAGDGRSMAEIAEEVGIGASYFSRIVRLGFLAPDIVRSILDGTQPIELSAKTLSLGVALPVEWDVQKRKLGFS